MTETRRGLQYIPNIYWECGDCNIYETEAGIQVQLCEVHHGGTNE